MRGGGLSESEWELIVGILSRHASVRGALLFGSRAKGTARASSDVDLALEGVEDPLEAEAIASELDDLALPYHFDVEALGAIRSRALVEHIARVGLRIYG